MRSEDEKVQCAGIARRHEVGIIEYKLRKGDVLYTYTWVSCLLAV